MLIEMVLGRYYIRRFKNKVQKLLRIKYKRGKKWKAIWQSEVPQRAAEASAGHVGVGITSHCARPQHLHHPSLGHPCRISAAMRNGLALCLADS